jgi:hypothetical protein
MIEQVSTILSVSAAAFVCSMAALIVAVLSDGRDSLCRRMALEYSFGFVLGTFVYILIQLARCAP